MDSVADEAVVEDRLSTLPLDLIHHILSFMDMKYAVQTCLLSTKWKHIWTTLRHIKFSTSEFKQSGQFSGFIRHVIAHRNDQVDVSSLEFTFDGTLSQIRVKLLLHYVVSHNVQKLTIHTSERDQKLPNCIFKSQSLKDLTLRNLFKDHCISPQCPWDLPNLTTLHLDDIVLSDERAEDSEYLDLFSKCVNLKSLIIEECYMAEVSVFMVSAPRLESLTVRNCCFHKLFISAPKLSSFVYSCHCPLSLSTNARECLEKVDLHVPMFYPLSNFEKEDASKLVKLFKKIDKAIYLGLCLDVIEVVFFYPDLLSSQPSTLDNLKHENMRQVSQKGNYTMVIVPDFLTDYFLHSSSSATITTEASKIKELGAVSDYEANPRTSFDI